MRTKLKGGSLSGTYLMDGFVRKECSLVENREYGYNRWYSQLKRLQRYNHLFPELFPRVLGYGVDGNMAYYDMEMVSGVNGYEFLKNWKPDEAIDTFFKKFIVAMSQMHSVQWESTPSPINLYIHEEIDKKLFDYKLWTSGAFGLFRLELSSQYSEKKECFTHGNLTLENVMYNQETGKITFIDPYEENIIDSRLCDYSQVLQSCHSHYEWYNEGKNGPIPSGVEYFRVLFHDTIYSNLSEERKRTVDLLEISQYIRMLPFKMRAGEESKADFFYSHAIMLYNQYQIKWSGR